ncbi:MAG: penicillin-binding protein 2 [Cyanobacteria bacterium P01_A01_bin.45]
MQKSSSETKIKNFQRRRLPRRRVNSLFNNKEQNSSHTSSQTADVKSRLFVVWGILMLAGLGLSLNLYNLQIGRGAKLTKAARSQQMVNMRPFIPRRKVVDRRQDILAVDRPVYTLYAHPNQFSKSKNEIAGFLSPIINQDREALVTKFDKRNSGIFIVSNLPEATADKLSSLRLNGLELIQKYSRYYPKENLVADVVGYIDSDRRGMAGVERSLKKWLERDIQTVRLSRAGNGALMPDYAPEGLLNFDDFRLKLTIDSRLQRASQKALEKQVKKFKAKRGAVIVMDVKDGSLLSMISYPTYNPNKYTKKDIPLFRNWMVADLYEPGSTFKPLNVAIALEAGVIEPNDVFNDTGSIQILDKEIKNAQNKRFGRLNIAQILQNSSNIGMVKIIQKLKPSEYYGALERIGLGQASRIDLPAEVSSRLKSQEEFINTPVESATASFGQGFSLTPLQLVQMIGALANDGKMVTPHIAKGLVDSDGKIHHSIDRAEPRPIFSPTTARKVVEMMETVVQKGSGKSARIPRYRIAGKTGTAQKAGNGGYIEGAWITSFVGILPVESPQYVVLAIVDEPKGENTYGSTVAAPIAKSVMEALIPLAKIQPSQSLDSN